MIFLACMAVSTTTVNTRMTSAASDSLRLLEPAPSRARRRAAAVIVSSSVDAGTPNSSAIFLMSWARAAESKSSGCPLALTVMSTVLEIASGLNQPVQGGEGVGCGRQEYDRGPLE